MTVCALYIIKHKQSGRGYVGVSTRCRYRWQRHRYDSRHGSTLPIHRALNKYGIDAFEWKVIAYASCRSGGHELEKMAIFLGMGYYNLTKGGEGLLGVPKSDRAKALISAANTGRRHTPEARLLMSEAKRGRKRKPFTEQTRSNMRDAWKLRKRKYAV